MHVETNLRETLLAHVPAQTREAEGLAFDGVNSSETQHNPFFPLVLAAEHSQRLTLSTSVAIAFPRSPIITAHAAWDLQSLSGGRFRLGLGTQVKGHNERRYGIDWRSPGPRLRDYIGALKAIWAINPYLCRLAGQVCDGLRLHGFTTPHYVRSTILPAIGEGLTKAGRGREAINICGGGFLATGATEAEVVREREMARQRIAFYGSTRTYHPVLAAHGWTALGEDLHELSLRGAWSEMTRRVPDEVVDAFTTCGTYDQIARRLRDRLGGLVDTLGFPSTPDNEAEREQIQAIVAELKTIPTGAAG